ncbi:sensor histidine kinase [Streptomyces sp. TR06-5]|uniref:sensor histidine kinase n=1 Tax=unclassified Streptomyces TaxID=2593676 RepID=UPI00399F1C50
MRAAAWHQRHHLATDLALAVLFAALDTATTLAGATWWPAAPSPTAWALLAVQAAACLGLVWRRRAPILVVGVLAAFTLTVTLLISPLGLIVPQTPGNLWMPYATVLAAYSPMLYCADRRTALLSLGVLAVIVSRVWEWSFPVTVVGLLSVTVGPLLALYFDARRRLVRALTERAERAERERHLLAEQARAEERARLAGEMHDVVTHRLSLMVLQAGALGVTSSDTAVRQIAEELRAGGCQALEELRDLVGVLRTPREVAVSPTDADFAQLIEESRSVGLTVELRQEGDRSLASPVVGRTAYRIVREALTNVRKHAPGAEVTVQVHYGDSRVRLSVHNTPAVQDPARSGLAATGSGSGIASLRQRVELVDGELRAGSSPDGGFRLEAVLPAFVATAEAAV